MGRAWCQAKTGCVTATHRRLLRVVLATESLRTTAEQGRQLIKSILVERGLVTLEDLQALESDHADNLLEQLSCASLEDLYAAVGGGAIRIEDVVAQLDRFRVTKDNLGWLTINILGSSMSNRPGVLLTVAGLVSASGGNILRSVNNTFPDGSFALRLIIKNISGERQQQLNQDFLNCGIEFQTLELV